MPATVIATGGNGSTLDITGATLIVAVNSAWSSGPTSFADSLGNTYTPLTMYGVNSYYGRMFYCENPDVGASVTFSGSGAFSKFSLIVFAGAGIFVSEGGFAAVGTTIQPGSILPPEPNCIVVAGIAFEPTSLVGIDGGFTVANTQPNVGGVGCSIAYLIQTTAAAANPTWTMAGSANLAAPIAVFKSLPAPGPTHTKLYLSNISAPYTPPTIRGAWNSTTGHLTKLLDWAKDAGGVVTSLTLGETSLTSPYAQLIYRGVSGPLAAQTFSGTVDVRIGVDVSSTAADFFWFLHLYVTVGNSDTVRGDLLTNYGEVTNEWPSSDIGDSLASPQTLAALAVSEGDRLVAEIGFISRNVVASNYLGQLYYGTESVPGTNAVDQTVGGAASRASHLVFSNPITQSTTVPLALISQVVAELASGSGDARLSQVLVELASGANSPFRLSQLVAELASGEIAPFRLSQLVAEVASGAIPPARLSQLVIEIASVPSPPDFTPSVWMGDGMGEIWIE